MAALGWESAPARTGTGRARAFILEALLLAAVLVFSLAVLMQTFGLAAARSDDARRLSEACAVAQATAELFCADPASVPAESERGDFRVTCASQATDQAAGQLWEAVITVWEAPVGADDEPVCSLETARFVEGGL